jgi:pilus assembly protein Flp/PilA
MQTFLWRFFADEFGATAIEYALVGSLISVACISGITAVGTSLLGSYTAITAALAFVLPLASGSGF